MTRLKNPLDLDAADVENANLRRLFAERLGNASSQGGIEGASGAPTTTHCGFCRNTRANARTQFVAVVEPSVPTFIRIERRQEMLEADDREGLRDPLVVVGRRRTRIGQAGPAKFPAAHSRGWATKMTASRRGRDIVPPPQGQSPAIARNNKRSSSSWPTTRT